MNCPVRRKNKSPHRKGWTSFEKTRGGDERLLKKRKVSLRRVNVSDSVMEIRPLVGQRNSVKAVEKELRKEQTVNLALSCAKFDAWSLHEGLHEIDKKSVDLPPRMLKEEFRGVVTKLSKQRQKRRRFNNNNVS